MNSIRPIQEWFHESDSGALVLHDPVSGQPIDPQAPSEFLRQEFQDNYDLLRYAMPQTQMGLFFTGDQQRLDTELGPYPEDNPKEEPYEKLLEFVTAASYGVDDIVATQDERRIRQLSMRNRQGRVGITDYHARILGGIASQQGMPSFPMGITIYENGDPTTDSGLLIRDMYKEAATHDGGTEMTRSLGRLVADNAWQWHAVGQFAAGLHKAREANFAYSDTRPYEGQDIVLAALPLRHSDIARKFEATGINGQGIGQMMASPDILTPEHAWNEQVLQQGYVDRRQLDYGF